MHKKIIKIMLCALILFSYSRVFVSADDNTRYVYTEDNNNFVYSFYDYEDRTNNTLKEIGSTITLINRSDWTTLFAVGYSDPNGGITIAGEDYFNKISGLTAKIDSNDKRTTLTSEEVSISVSEVTINGIKVPTVTIRNLTDNINLSGQVVVVATFNVGDIENIEIKRVINFTKKTEVTLTIDGTKDIKTINQEIAEWIKNNPEVTDGSKQDFTLNFANNTVVNGDIVIDFDGYNISTLVVNGHNATLNGSITVKRGLISVQNLNLVKTEGCKDYGVMSESSGIEVLNCTFKNYSTGTNAVMSKKCTYDNCTTAIESSTAEPEEGVNSYNARYDENKFLGCTTALKINKYYGQSEGLSVSKNEFIGCATEFDITHSKETDEYFFFLNNYYGSNGEVSSSNYKSPTIKGSTEGLYVVTSPARMFPGETAELGIDNQRISALFNGEAVTINSNSKMNGAEFVVFDRDTGKAVSTAVVPE